VRVFCVVLNTDSVPDGEGDIHPPMSATFDEVDGVPVHVGFERENLKSMVGRAYLEHMPGGQGVFADVDIFDSVLNEKVADLMYPFVCGVVLKREGQVFESIEVRSIGLSFNRNSDHRIDTLGNQKRKAQGKS
jgi:hypothetical protein